jgi:hypothetical protein
MIMRELPGVFFKLTAESRVTHFRKQLKNSFNVIQ